MRKEESDLTLRNAETILKKEEVKKMVKTFTKFNEDEELNDFEEDLIVEKPPVTRRNEALQGGQSRFWRYYTRKQRFN